jgi:uncharacterized protein YegL
MFMKHLRRFATDRRANILPMFGLAFIPVVGLIGAAVDYSRANAVKTKLQAALDSTALAMSAKAASQSAGELQASALSYFNALFQSTDAGTVAFSATYAMTSTGPQVTVTGATSVPTKFMNIPGFGIPNIPVNGSSTSAWGNTRLRVALALDNTGSMGESGKMPALKTAAKALIDQLKASATNNGDVYVSLVPFARDVNVGRSNYNAAWLDWEEWEDDNGQDTSTTTCTTKKTGKSGKSTKKCSTTTTWVPDNHNTWNGCVTDRDQPSDVNNDPPSPANNGKTLFPTDQYDDCPVEMMPLTYNWTALKNKIDSMTPAGNTNTTIGLEWAWHSLTQGAPLFAPAEEANYDYTKVIIFMTDGENTQNRWSTNQSTIDARMTAACKNVKDAGITVYTILVLDGTPAILQSCASGPDKYYKITNANQMVSVFNQIGTKLSRLRVAK